jgi:kynureninase
MVSFYRPTKIKHKIGLESDAVESQLKFHGFSAEDIIQWKPRENEELLKIEDVEKIVETRGDAIVLLLIGGVNHCTGPFLDFQRMATRAFKRVCCWHRLSTRSWKCAA